MELTSSPTEKRIGLAGSSLFWGLPALLLALFFSGTAFYALGTYTSPDTPVDFFQSRTFGYPRELLVRQPFPSFFYDVVLFRLPEEWRFRVLAGLQQIGVVLQVVLIFALFYRRGRPMLAGVASFAWAGSIIVYIYAQTSWSEPVFLTWLVTACFLVSEGLRTGRWQWLVVAGMVAALAMVTRRVGVAMVPVFCLAALFQWGFWRGVPKIGAFLLPWVLVVCGFMAWNHGGHGRFALSEEKGVHLFHRVSTFDRDFVETEAWERVREVAEENGIDPWAKDTGWGIRSALVGEGLTELEADQLLGEVAMTEIWSDPLEFGVDSLKSLVALVQPADTASWFPCSFTGLTASHWDAFEGWHAGRGAQEGWGEWYGKFRDGLHDYPPLKKEGWVVEMWDALDRSILAGWWHGTWVLIALPLIGAFALWRRDPLGVFLAGVAVLSVLIASVGERPLPRFWISSMPVFLMSLTWAIGALLSFKDKELSAGKVDQRGSDYETELRSNTRQSENSDQ